MFHVPSIHDHGHYELPQLTKQQKWGWAKHEVAKLLERGLFYQPNSDEYRYIIDEIANPFYWKVDATTTYIHSQSKRQVKNWFFQAVACSKQGRPFLIQDQKKEIASNKIKRHRSNVDPAKLCHETSFQMDSVQNDQKQTEEDSIEFIFKSKALKHVNMQKNYGCYDCDEKVHHYSGGFCSMKKCCHPVCLKRPGNPLQFHNHCLIPLDRSKHRVCGHCAFYLYERQYRFSSGNGFIQNWCGVSKFDAVQKINVRGEVYILFICSKVGPRGSSYCTKDLTTNDYSNEYYLMCLQKDILLLGHTTKIRNAVREKLKIDHQKTAAQILNHFIAWNNRYLPWHARDQYELLEIPITDFKKPHSDQQLLLQQLRSKYNKLIPSWCVIDGLDFEYECQEIVNFVCHHLYDAASSKLKQNPGPIGAYFANASLSMVSINYCYKVIMDKRIRGAAPSKNVDEFAKLDDHELFESSLHYSDAECQHLHAIIHSMTEKINELTEYLSKNVDTMHQYENIQFKSSDLGAGLIYKRNQAKHIDSNQLMDFDDLNRANSSLWMVNPCVNADEISYDADTDRFSARHVTCEPKIACFDDVAMNCQSGNSRCKHLMIKKGSVVLAIPPDVSLMAHQMHNITNNKYTIVWTCRGLSDSVKNKAKSLDSLSRDFGLKCKLI